MGYRVDVGERLPVTFLFVVSCLACVSGVQAQVTAERASPTGGAVSAPEPAPYALQMLLLDGAAWGAGAVVGALAASQDARRFGDVSATAWGLGAAGSVVLHAAHGQRGRAAAALGIRAIAPPSLALLGLGGACLLSGIATGCAGDGARWGFVAGALLASAADAAFLAREPREPSRLEWYGWQPALLDVGFLAAGSVLVVTSKNDLDRGEAGIGAAVLPWVGGTLVAPIVHACHGRWLAALASFGLRSVGSGFGALAGLMGYCAATGGDSGCTATGAGYGLLAGTIVMAVVDDALLAHAPRDGDAAPQASLVPSLMPSQGGVSIGLRGTL